MDKHTKDDKKTSTAEDKKPGTGCCKTTDKTSCSTPKTDHKKQLSSSGNIHPTEKFSRAAIMAAFFGVIVAF